MSGANPRAILDCNVLFQAFLGSGASARCLALADSGDLQLHTSHVALEELRDVLARPKIRVKHPRITSRSVSEFFDHLFNVAHVLTNVPHIFTFDRDPDDEPYLDLAAAVRADFLVTRDNDLLSLVTGSAARAATGIDAHLPLLRIVSPEELLQIIAPRPTIE
jgi:putative PIN family toxin of toxin-antitoxin system